MRPIFLAAAAAAAMALSVFAAVAVEGKRIDRIVMTDDDFFDSRYEPANATVVAGDRIEVVNTGADKHTLTDSTGTRWPEVNLDVGGEGSFIAPGTPGEYRFYCRFHASPEAEPGVGMAGLLVVVEGEDAGDGEGEGTPVPGVLAVVALGAAALAFRRRR
ncbi:MAG: cupredoxin domain-containing protein [Methanobacteriota archaeon]